MSKKLIIPAVAIAAMAGAVVGGVALSSGEAVAAKGDKEKCYGVAKAGKNDCGNLAGTHGCAGQAKMDGDKGEWLYLPKGVCDKLDGGITNPTKG